MVVASPIDPSQDVEIEVSALEQLVARTDQMRDIGPQLARVISVGGIQFGERSEPFRHVFGRSFVNEIEVLCVDGNALQNGRDTADDDELHLMSGENFNQP